MDGAATPDRDVHTETIPAASDPGGGTAIARGALPNLIIIGAQKCGTSTLHYYLSLHPEVSMSEPKELNYFIEERNFHRGPEWYARHFDPRAKVRGEASPNYTAHPQRQGVPQRMAALVPDVKLIYIVRDPLERLAAHWVHNYAKRREKGTMAETFAAPGTSYVPRSMYARQLELFLEHYDREQILVIENTQLRGARLETLRRVFGFIGVEEDFQHPSFEHERHATARKKRATKMGMRLQKLSKTSRGQKVPRKVWLAMDLALPLAKPISKPPVEEVQAALSEETISELRADADRLAEISGLDLSHWKL